MRYKLFGKSGLRVSEICLGTMTFGLEWGWGASKAESRKMFDRFADTGGNFIDTANMYTDGTSEKLTGEFIRADREHFVLATKYSLSMRKGDPNFSGNHRKNMVQSLEASLKRLKTEYVDIYWVHAWDFMTPIEEVMRGLDDLVHAGKVHYIGISDTPAWIVARANTMAGLKDWTAFTGMQIKYSLAERTAERDLLPLTREDGMAVTVWGALASGLLSGKFHNRKKRMSQKKNTRINPATDSKFFTEKNLAVTGKIMEIAEAMDRPPAQIALNWVRQQQGTIIPIVGARNDKQLKENLECLEFNLDKEQLWALDDVSRIELGFPHEFLRTETVLQKLYGGTLDSIDLE
ncbi:aldo/keto reductase [Fibrobacterota bacterium]